MNAALRGALELAGYGLQSAGIAVEQALDPLLARIEADPDQLGQVAVNLVVNAQAALADRPEPRIIRLESWARPPASASRSRTTARACPPTCGRRSSSPMSRPSRSAPAPGSGSRSAATSSARMAARSGWSRARWAARASWCGCRYGQPQAPEAAEAAAGLVAMRHRVLVVDDEPEVGSALAELLGLHGIESELVNDIPAAVARLDAQRFDAVFCDLRMPGGGGGQLYRHAVASQPHLRGRFAFVTGDTVAGPGAIAALDPGHPPPILEKPFTPQDVAEVLQKVREDGAG